MQEFTDLAFLASYATLSVAAFAFLQSLVVPPVRESVRNKSTAGETQISGSDVGII